MLDWDDLRYFLALARHGTLSAAARALAVSQPTIGRRLAALEARMGTRLFLRTPNRHALTGAGSDILHRVEAMEREVELVERAATGRDAGLGGVVRVTSTRWLSGSVLPAILGPLGSLHDGLIVDVVATSMRVSLLRREADVAVRFARFEHEDVVQRRVAHVTFGLYASAAYLEARGEPEFARGCRGHCVVTFDERVTTASDGAYLDEVASAARVSFRSNSRDALARACAAGAGIACLPDHLGARTPGLRRLTPREAPPSRALWLGVHADTKGLPRIRTVTRALTEGLAAVQAELAPYP